MENKFYKVAESGFSLTSALFFNPVTKETFSKIVWDLDDDRLLYDDEIQEMRNAPIVPEAVAAYRHHMGIISVGDKIEVYKGRKVPKGTVAVVVELRDWRDCYGRVRTTYAYLDNGMRTSIDNCKIID